MANRVPLTLILAALLAPGLPAVAQDLDKYRDPEGMSGEVGDVAQITDRRGEQLPLDVRFDDSAGERVTLQEYFDSGKPVLLQFVYFKCPSLCTLALNSTSDLLKRMKMTPGEDFILLTISINPQETSNLARLKKRAYLEETYPDPERRATAESGWRFLTGTRANIDTATEAAGFGFRFDTESQEYAHGAGLFVLTPEGVISRTIYGVSYVPQTVRLSLVEAADGKIGTALDRILLFCYHYDPATGKYTAQIMTITRVIGVGMVVILAGLMGFLFRYERRRMRQLEQELVEEHDASVPASPGAAS